MLGLEKLWSQKWHYEIIEVRILLEKSLSSFTLKFFFAIILIKILSAKKSLIFSNDPVQLQ